MVRNGTAAKLGVCMVAMLLHCQDAIVGPNRATAGAPVLVLTDAEQSSNPLGSYMTEMLRAEGLVAMDQAGRSTWSASADPAAFLASYDVLVMSEMNLSVPEQQLLRSYVQNGGVLIAARPDSGLSDLFGIQVATTRSEQLLQYYGVDATTSAGQGITQTAMQYHGAATNYTLQVASALAYLYNDAQTQSTNPAVTTNSYGLGKAVAFAFDPAKSVVLTRQGNPDWKDTEGDNLSGYRPHDMFSRTDGTTYYDPSRLPIPQADEMQRFVANILIDHVEKPLPRMWYLPGTHKSIMINTGDGESNYGSQFNQVLNDAASYGGSFSLYLREVGIQNTTVSQESVWRAAGHEVGVHAFGNGAEGAGAGVVLSQAYSQIVSDLQNKFGHGARTARNHTIDWTGWVDMAEIEAASGTQLDTNYYHYLDTTHLDPLTNNGYFTGGGLPQRLINANGQVLPIYQAATQWPDEWFADAGMTAQQTVDVITTMFETAEEQGYYSAFVNNIHPARYNGSDNITSSWAQAVWAYSQAHGIPQWSAEMLLDFVEARNNSQFENISWETDVQQQSNLLEFDYLAGAFGHELTVMIPMNWQGQGLESIDADGAPMNWTTDQIKGIEYALLTIPTLDAAVADYNNDGIIDAADYTVWKDTLGSATDLRADGDGNGSIGQNDYVVWQNNFGVISSDPAPPIHIMAFYSDSSLALSVPEPPALLLGCCAAVFCCCLPCPVVRLPHKHIVSLR